MDRRTPWEGIGNCRDLGGLPVGGGRTIRRGVLLRSAHLASAAESDLEGLRARGVDLVIDLRTGMEREQRPDRVPEGTRELWRPIFDEAAVGITREKQMRPGVPDMAALYRMMVTEEGCRAALGEVLWAVMSHDAENGAVLWHCTAGKDRCGLVSALLLLALGADRETVLADYLLTNETARGEAEAVYVQLLSARYEESLAAAMREAFLAKEEYLAAALDAIDERYTSPEDYLIRGLGLKAGLLADFCDRMLD